MEKGEGNQTANCKFVEEKKESGTIKWNEHIHGDLHSLRNDSTRLKHAGLAGINFLSTRGQQEKRKTE